MKKQEAINYDFDMVTNKHGSCYTKDSVTKMINEVYEKINVDFEKLLDVTTYTNNKELIITRIRQTHNLYKTEEDR